LHSAAGGRYGPWMTPCRAVGLEFFDLAPHRFVAEEIVTATPAQIFDVFEDPESWTVWALPIQKVEWTSPKPYGVGTTRTVSMIGGLAVVERFIAWERGTRMAFCVESSTSGTLESFAEDYHVTELGDGRCRVRWIVGLAPKGAGKIGLSLFGWALGVGLRTMFGRFRTYVEQRHAGAAAAA